MSELIQLQERIENLRRKRGFVTDPIKIQLLLTGEIG
jgi:hypothetical protein